MASIFPGVFASIARTSSATAFRYTRSVFPTDFITSVVDRSSPRTSASLIPSLTGASFVAMNRVPMLTPSAPSARHAASWRPLPIPPDAMYGTRRRSAALARSTNAPTSSSPGCPAHSNPSTLMQSAPSRSAVSACLIATHLCTTVTPCFLKYAIHSPGLRPAVSTTGTRSSTMTRA